MNAPPSKAARRFVLASSSPQRAQLLRAAGYEFEIVPPGEAEAAARANPRELVERLAYFKARGVADRIQAGLVLRRSAGGPEHGVRPQREDIKGSDPILPPPGLVLAADTIVVLGDQVIGKPADAADARRILRTLAGTRHVVMTGVCLLDAATGVRIVGSDATRIRMRPMSDHQIDDYVSSGEALGKAGAYAVRADSDPYVEELDGSFTNVVGLPMELLARLMRVAEVLMETQET
jgi:septum formation protein